MRSDDSETDLINAKEELLLELRAEKKKSQANHWSYDYNNHVRLHKGFNRLQRDLH